MQDQPLLRRVVSAAELGAPATLGAHGEFSGTNELKVNDIPNPGAIVGYRLMASIPDAVAAVPPLHLFHSCLTDSPWPF